MFVFQYISILAILRVKIEELNKNLFKLNMFFN